MTILLSKRLSSIPCSLLLALITFSVTALTTQQAVAQDIASPNVLIVVAHPDDDAMFAAAVYKITHSLAGSVDLALVTDGSGGFRYSQLAEPIYGIKLTDETIARQYLPAIRKRELMAGGKIVGIRNYFFLDQLDHQYTENTDTVLSHVWDTEAVRTRLRQIMTRVEYDYVFVHLPIQNFHAHHKAATILALETARDLPAELRPVVLGSFVGSTSDTSQFGVTDFVELGGFPVTRVRSNLDPFVFDRGQPLSPDGRLTYRIIVNWLIAEHKSQGTMQLLMNQGDIERYWFFDINNASDLAQTREFFEQLADSIDHRTPGG